MSARARRCRSGGKRQNGFDGGAVEQWPDVLPGVLGAAGHMSDVPAHRQQWSYAVSKSGWEVPIHRRIEGGSGSDIVT